VFILKHQDGDIKYIFERGGFAIVESKLYLSIETKTSIEDAFLDSYLFAIDGYFLLNNQLENSIIQIATNPNDEPSNVYVYTTFHACDVEAEISIDAVSYTEITVSINLTSEDVNYYDDNAKRNLFVGVVNLNRCALEKIWIPS